MSTCLSWRTCRSRNSSIYMNAKQIYRPGRQSSGLVENWKDVTNEMTSLYEREERKWHHGKRRHVFFVVSHSGMASGSLCYEVAPDTCSESSLEVEESTQNSRCSSEVVILLMYGRETLARPFPYMEKDSKRRLLNAHVWEKLVLARHTAPLDIGTARTTNGLRTAQSRFVCDGFYKFKSACTRLYLYSIATHAGPLCFATLNI